MMNKSILISVCFMLVLCMAPAQEALKSSEEEYYDFLSLQGLTKRPTLNYRTLSDSVWTILPPTTDNIEQSTDGDVTSTGSDAVDHVWSGNNLGTKCTINGNERLSWKIYGPEWFNSFNTAAPYGQNDGALWQGKGYNTSLTAGARLEAYGFAVTLKPQLCFSQNLAFDIMTSNYDSPYGYFWGYGNNAGIDLPQRFGDAAFWTFDWGDTEVRYSWKTLTVGFGTQAIWLGPAWLNPMLHSNNAPTYPKVDIGLRRQPVSLPWLGWYIGDIEARIWIGRLTESDYFDNDDGNDHNLYNGFSVSYAPSFLPGLTLSAAKVCLSKWGDSSWKYLNPFYSTNDAEDQKASISADWLLPAAGIEVYGEIGIDDYTVQKWANPFHTAIYTVGLKKSMQVSKKHNIFGELIFEWNNFELSQDFQMQWKYMGYYCHNLITQGYTQKGQILGAGSGYFGNSQYIGLKLYYPKGTSTVYLHRHSPETNFNYNQSIGNDATYHSPVYNTYWAAYKTYRTIGVVSSYFITPNFVINGEFTHSWILFSESTRESKNIRNFHITLGGKYTF